ARDRNYEFWGNQVFYGENPPQAAALSYFVKNKPNDVKLKIAEPAGREIREIAIPSSAVKAGINSACWDLRVQPVPAPPALGAAGARGTQGSPAPGSPADPFGYGCGTTGGGGGGGGGFGGFGGGGPIPGPVVLAGTYTVALVVDGKPVDTKPLRVLGDPEVVLSDAQRKQLFDMAAEMHDLQKRASEAAT